MGNAQDYAAKVASLETNASADLTNSEVKTKYEANADTNNITDAEKTKLEGIPYSAYTYPSSLSNGWVNYSADETGYAHASYMKDENGTVFIKGLIKNGTISTTLKIFTLPVGYRPIAKIIRAVTTNPNVMGRLDIASNGDVIPNAGSNVWFSIECSFKAEQ